MRRAPSRVIAKCTCVLSVLLALFSFASLAFAQTRGVSKRKLSSHPVVLSQLPMAATASAGAARPNAPPPTTSATWTGSGGDNNWGTATNWNPNGVPNSSTVLVTIGTTTANVNLNINATVDTLTLSNSGDVLGINNNQNLTVDGNITNKGQINLNSGGNFTELIVGASGITLSGTGTVNMGNNANNIIFGAAGTDTLTNSSTIQGAGQIGDASMALVNSGTIDATQSTSLIIHTSNGDTNTGTLEATTGTLILQGDTISNTGGTIKSTGSDVQLNGVTINGGTITTTGSGLIHTINGQSGTLENLTNTGNYQVDNMGATVLVGTITNNGNINLASVGNFTDLQLSGNVTLSGTGTLTMSNNANNRIYGASGLGTEVFTNNTNISGAGQIGVGQTLINNTTLGTINANQPNALIIAPTSTNSAGVTNTGLMEATSGGTLQLNPGSYINAVGSTQGTILANGGTVNLEAGVTIVGGTLKTQSGGVIQNVANAATLDGSTSTGAVTIVSGSSFSVVNNTILDVKGSIVNNGTVSLNSVGNFTDLQVTGSSATLSGTGTLTMSNNSNNRIYGAVGTDTFTNQETIQGSGNIGVAQLTFVNSGTVNANQSTALTIETSGGTTNTGTLEATAGGTLALDGTGGTTITNTGGTIQAIGASGNNAAVTLQNGITITGGTITSNSFGSFNVGSGAAPTLSGLTNTGTVNVTNNSVLNLAGTIVNNGTINLNSVGNFTDLALSGNVALNGTGTVTMSNNSNNRIYGGVAGDVLTVASTQTIQGAGQIGVGQMVLVNNGTINANTSSPLTIQTSGGTTNAGTLEASSGGTLVLTGASAGNITNTGAGKVTANTGGTVDLEGNVTVSGGSLTGGGTFIVNGVGGNATLSGLTNSSTVQVANNNTMFLTGNIVNNGQIQVNSAGNFTEIQLTGNVTLNGTGTLVMSDNPNNFIFGVSGSDVLTNASTIEGAGHIGDGQMGLVNSGTINATGTNVLAINVSGTVNNTGTFEATNSGGLTVTAPTGNFLNYTSGTNTLTNGTYIANGGNVTLPLGTGGGISTLAASITEEGGSQVLNSNNGNANALNGLTSITSKGALTIGGVTFTDAGSFSNAGSLTLLSGESFTVGSLTQISGGSLTAGTYVLDANLNLSGTAQTITTNAATLTLAGGTIHNNSGSTNALAGLATNTGKLTIGGASNNVSTTASSFSNTGTLTINAGDSFTASKLTQISGTTLTAGTYVLNGNLDLTTAGLTITKNSATLTLQGGTINSNGVNALSALATNTGKLTIGGTANNISTTAASFSNTGTLTINSGDSFTAPALTQISGSTLTAGTYVLAGNLDLAATANITTNSANLTLEGGSIKTGSTNDLANLNNNTNSLTLANNASFTAVGNFTNSGALTINKASTFALTGSNLLTNLSSGTLASGTYTIGGTLQLTSANGGITTNAANLTLTGTSAKILDGTSNALAGFNNNMGTFTLASSATLTTPSGNFTNSGTAVVSKGTTLTVGGTNNSYNQSAGTTTVDGTLANSGTGAISVTGGKIQGVGTLKANVSIGGAGTTPAINVGDAGKAGLLKITGTYAQLSTGTMNVSIGGTTVGTQFSQLQVSGTASLGGTLTAALVNGFTPTVGQTFTVLTASSVAGTFSNSTIAINSSEHFAVSYTSTGVVLTVASGPVSKSPNTALVSQMVAASTKQAIAIAKPIVLSSRLKYKIGGGAKPVLVAGLQRPGGRSNKIVTQGSELYRLRADNRRPTVAGWDHTSLEAVAQPWKLTTTSVRQSLPAHNYWIGTSHGINPRPTPANWSFITANRRAPVVRMLPALPPIRR